MEYSDYLKKRMKNPEFKRLVAQERLIADAQEEIGRLLKEKKVSRAELAKRLNKSKSFVTQLLNSGRNLTLRTIADVFTALGSEVTVKEKEKEVQEASDVYTFHQKKWKTVREVSPPSVGSFGHADLDLVSDWNLETIINPDFQDISNMAVIYRYSYKPKYDPWSQYDEDFKIPAQA